MVQTQSILKVADNSGAKTVMVIKVLGGYKKRYSHIGNIIVGAVKTANPHSAVKKSDVVHAVIVRTKKEIRRPDGSYVRFDDNACVIIDKERRSRKAAAFSVRWRRELRNLGFMKIISLAPEVL